LASRAIHLRKAPQNKEVIVERLFEAAFRAPFAGYRRKSLCGWGLVLDYPPDAAKPLHREFEHRQPAPPDNMDGVVIRETVDAILLEIEVPHLKAESLYLEISGNLLIVRGERIAGAPPAPQAGDNDGDVLNFERLIVLPAPARPGQVRARLVGHVVKINILKQ
jgi:HSP20 family molecular chaperone IbpA